MTKRINIVGLSLIIGLLMPLSAYAVSVNDLADMLTRLEQNIPAIRSMISAFCYVAGLAMILKSVMMFKKYGQMRTMMASDTSMAKPLIVLFIGVGLYAIPDVIDVGMKTIYNYGSQSVMKYPQAADWSRILDPLVTIVKLMGLIVFVKGFLMLSKFGGQAQPGVGGKATMHMIGGLLAMNIVDTIDIVKASFGL